MTDQAHLKDQRPFTGKHMLIIMLSFFGVIIIVNLTMATLATKSWTGLVVKNGYIASQHFNKNQQAHEKLVAAGWQSSLDYNNGIFTLTLLKNSKALTNCDVTGLLNRPVHENDNQRLMFKYTDAGSQLGSGQYIAHNQLQPGRWNLEVQALCSKDQPQRFIQTYKFLAPKLPTKLAPIQ